MIKTVTTGIGVTVTLSPQNVYSPSSISQPSCTGMIRWNGSLKAMEVMDGTNWQLLNGQDVSIALDYQAQEVIEWARKKMKEENDLTELMRKYPGLKEMHDKFEMMKVLFAEHNTSKETTK